MTSHSLIIALQSFDGLSASEAASGAFSSAVRVSTADALEVPLRAVSGVTITLNRRMLLVTTAISYTFDLNSTIKADTVAERFSKATDSGLFLNSMKSSSGLPIEALTSSSIVEVVPFTPQVNAVNRSTRRGKSIMFLYI